MKILVLAPHPFFQARGTPLAVRTVLEFLSARGHQVDVLTLHEGEDVTIADCRIHRIPRLPGIRNVRAGFSMKKVVCDGVMVVECLRMVRRTRYDLIHAVEESAFIAAIASAVSGIPYIYDMDSSLAEQLVERFPRIHSLLPFLRYPANPPGVGDPATIGLRTGAWLAAIVIGLAVVAAAWQVHGRLRAASEPARHLAVAGVLVAGTALLWLLPANPDPVDTPAEVIWPFRMLSLLAIALLWAALGAGFGLAGVRAARTAGAAAPSPTAA